jgi:AcrR family transcriptional regulator
MVSLEDILAIQKRSEVTRTQILEAALICFSKNGFDATGVAEICEVSRVSKGAFYHHFPSKQAVFLCLLHDWLDGLETTLSAITNEYGTVPEAFTKMVGMTQEIFTSASGKIPMFLEFWMQARRDPIVWEATVEPYKHYQSIFANLIKRGIQEGTLQPVDPENVARIIVAFAVGLLLQGALEPDATNWTGVAGDGIQMLVKGMKK